VGKGQQTEEKRVKEKVNNDRRSLYILSLNIHYFKSVVRDCGQQPTPIEDTVPEIKEPSKRDVENNFHINS